MTRRRQRPPLAVAVAALAAVLALAAVANAAPTAAAAEAEAAAPTAGKPKARPVDIQQLLPDVSASGVCKEDARVLCDHLFEDEEDPAEDPEADKPRQEQEQPAPQLMGEDASAAEKGDGARRLLRALLAADDADPDPPAAAADKQPPPDDAQATTTTDASDDAALATVAERLRAPYPVRDRAALAKASPLARCLRQALHDEQYGVHAGGAGAQQSKAPGARVSDACADDVRAFLVGRAGDPARDPALLEACATEAVRLCAPSLSVRGPARRGAGANGAPEPLVTCLSRRKLADGFSVRCAAAVGLRQQEGAEDVALDPALLGACADDLKALCPAAMAPGAWRHDASAARVCLERIAVSSAAGGGGGGGKGGAGGEQGGAGAGGEQERPRLSKGCASALFSRMARDSEDIRYHHRLSSACARDAAAFCSGVRPGNSRVVDCLEDSRHDAAFSPACGAALADSMLLRASDARLDWPLRKSCELDADRFCSSPLLQRGEAPGGDGDGDGDALLVGSSSSSILQDVRFQRALPGEGFNITGCLRRHVDQLEYDSCRAAVRRRAVQAYEDSTLDAELMVACARNATDNCPDPRRAVGCLKDLLRQRASLAPACRLVLAARLREASGDLRYVPEVARECRAERARFCAGVGEAAPGGGDERRAAHDAGGRFGGYLSGDGAAGDVLDCLSDFAHEGGPAGGGGGGGADGAQDAAVPPLGAGGGAPFFGDACRAALNDHLALAVEDVRQMRGLSRDCAEDRASLCPGVAPGRGRVVACLQEKRARVREPRCRRQLLRLMGLAASDYRLDYALREACEADVRRQCAHVRPGGGRVHQCLRQNEGPGLEPRCLREVRRTEAAEHADIRLHRELGAACAGAAALFCGGTAPGEASVISCLRESAAAAESAAGAGGLARWWDGVVTGAGVRWDSAPSLAMPEDWEGGGGEELDGDAAEGAANNDTDAATAAAPSAAAFPAACRRALRKQLHRASTRLSFNPRLHASCREDLVRHCPATAAALHGAGDAGAVVADASAATAAAPAGNGTDADAADADADAPLSEDQASAVVSRDDHDRAAMECLGRTEAELSPECGAALGEATRLLMHDFLPRASLTSPCDADAARLCGATPETAPLMEPGGVRGCLVRHLHDLERGCWSLVSRVEPGAARERGERVEAMHYDPEEEEAEEEAAAAAAAAAGGGAGSGKRKRAAKKAARNKKNAAGAAVVGEIARHIDARGAEGLDAALRDALRSTGGDAEDGGVLYAALLQALSSTDEARKVQREGALLGRRAARAGASAGGPPGWLLWGAVLAAALVAVAGVVALARYAARMRTMLRGGQIVYKDGRA